MPCDLIDQFHNKLILFQVMTWCHHARSHHLNLWLGHNKLIPRLQKCWVVWQAFCQFHDLGSTIMDLPSQLLKLFFLLSRPVNLISYLIHYMLTCPGANFTGKMSKPKFYSPRVIGRPLILHTPQLSSYVFLVLSYRYRVNHNAM